jgi:hypothetical protein
MGFIRKIDSWEEVERVTANSATCIRPEATNWVKAKQTWDVFAPDDCQYFTPTTGASRNYIRVLLCGQSGSQKMYAVDYAHGDNKYLMILEAALMVDGFLICGDFYTADVVIRDKWPIIIISLPYLVRYPYHARQPGEAMWRVVPK